MLRNVFRWLKAPEQTHLRRAFTVFLGRVYFNDRPDLIDIFASAKREEEVDAMLATRLEEWKRGIYTKGVEEGIEKGIEKGTEKRNLEIARKLLLEGVDASLIARTCGLSMEQIEALKKKP